MSGFNDTEMSTFEIVEELMQRPSLMISFPNMEDMPSAELLEDISGVPLSELPARLAELIAGVRNPAEATATGFGGNDSMYHGTVSDIVQDIDYDDLADLDELDDHAFADHLYDSHNHAHSRGSGLNGGAIAGIVIGVVTAIIILCAISAKIGRKMQRRSLINKLYNTPSRALHTTVEDMYSISNFSKVDAEKAPSRFQNIEQTGNVITITESVKGGEEMDGDSSA